RCGDDEFRFSGVCQHRRSHGNQWRRGQFSSDRIMLERYPAGVVLREAGWARDIQVAEEPGGLEEYRRRTDRFEGLFLRLGKWPCGKAYLTLRPNFLGGGVQRSRCSPTDDAGKQNKEEKQPCRNRWPRPCEAPTHKFAHCQKNEL